MTAWQYRAVLRDKHGNIVSSCWGNHETPELALACGRDMEAPDLRKTTVGVQRRPAVEEWEDVP